MRLVAHNASLTELRRSLVQYLVPVLSNRPPSSLQQYRCTGYREQTLLLQPWQSMPGNRSVIACSGMPFSLERPKRWLNFKWGRRYAAYAAEDMQVEVDMLKEGSPAGFTQQQLDELLQQLEEDAQQAVPLALAAKWQVQPKYKLPAIANLSFVLCDDAHIQQLNKEYRGKDAPTDVLSFEIPDEGPAGMQLPVKLLGDLVVSLDTARRQASERGHSLLSELRILLVHGLLHLAGFDHEQGEQQLQQMAQHERDILEKMGWEGSGLISAAEAAALASSSIGTSSSGTAAEESPSSAWYVRGSRDSDTGSEASASGRGTELSPSSRAQGALRMPLVALDMDGTLLDSSSRIQPGSVKVIKAAVSAGVRVILATGKARPAAIAACRSVGLAGDALLVSLRTPGVFLQGLAVHGNQGQQLSDAALPPAVVQQAFEWASATNVSCVAFLGDHCATLKLTDDLRELHTRYYEPLAQELGSIDELMAGTAVRKLLFMADPHTIDGLAKAHWNPTLQGQAADVLQAVPNMLELVPSGVNKWAGLQLLLDHLQLHAEQLLAVGDGSNDHDMVSNAGLGVAMGNAVPSVKEAADVVVASNDDGGIVEAFERFVL